VVSHFPPQVKGSMKAKCITDTITTTIIAEPRR